MIDGLWSTLGLPYLKSVVGDTKYSEESCENEMKNGWYKSFSRILKNPFSENAKVVFFRHFSETGRVYP